MTHLLSRSCRSRNIAARFCSMTFLVTCALALVGCCAITRCGWFSILEASIHNRQNFFVFVRVNVTFLRFASLPFLQLQNITFGCDICTFNNFFCNDKVFFREFHHTQNNKSKQCGVESQITKKHFPPPPSPLTQKTHFHILNDTDFEISRTSRAMMDRIRNRNASSKLLDRFRAQSIAAIHLALITCFSSGDGVGLTESERAVWRAISNNVSPANAAS